MKLSREWLVANGWRLPPLTELPYMLRRQQHRIGKSGRKSEKRLTRDLEGRERPASGAMPGAKGDIDLGQVLLEAKSTTQASMGVKLDWLPKIAKEARAEGKSPALSVSFVDEQGQPLPRRRMGDGPDAPFQGDAVLAGMTFLKKALAQDFTKSVKYQLHSHLTGM